MIVKFFKRGSGSCKATMDYLLGKDRDRENAKVLQGDPELTMQLAESLEFKNKYTTGVLSFKEKDLDDKTKKEIMADFEKSLLCLEREQYDITWIEHKDKDRLELNFVIPKVELNTGRAMNPYFDAVDRKRVNAFKNYTNAKYDLHDPNDPANKQAYSTKMALPNDKKELQKAITGFLMQKIGEGTITDRNGVLRALQSDLELSIARTTKQSISIKDPTNENGRNIRLKSEIYAETFRFSKDYTAENERERREYRENRSVRIDETRAELEKEIARKREFNKQLYREPLKEHKQDYRKGIDVQKHDNDRDRSVPNHSYGATGAKYLALQATSNNKNRAGTDRAENRANTNRATPTVPSPSLRLVRRQGGKNGDSSDTKEQRRIHAEQEQAKNLIHKQLKEKLRLEYERILKRLRELDDELGTTLTRVRNAYNDTERTDKVIRESEQSIDRSEHAVIRASEQTSRTEHSIEQRKQQIDNADYYNIKAKSGLEYREHKINWTAKSIERTNRDIERGTLSSKNETARPAKVKDQSKSNDRGFGR